MKLSILCLLIATVSLAEAEPKKKTRRTKAKKETVTKPAKNYDFLADDIDGSRVMPDNTTVFGITNLKHKSLIRVRSHFIAEIIKTAEDQ